MSITAFWHIAQMNHWKEMVQEQSAKLSVFPKIIIGKVGNESLPDLPPQFQIGYEGTDLKEFEYPTLDLLWEYCQENQGIVFYCHTKGVSYGPDMWAKLGSWWQEMGVESEERLMKNIREWRIYMEYFNIVKRKKCLEYLAEGNDLCGVSFYPNPPHFQGNFWWAKASYIRTLSKPSIFQLDKGSVQAPRAAAEYWVCSGCPRIKNMCDTRHNLYFWGMNYMRYGNIHL